MTDRATFNAFLELFHKCFTQKSFQWLLPHTDIIETECTSQRGENTLTIANINSDLIGNLTQLEYPTYILCFRSYRLQIEPQNILTFYQTIPSFDNPMEGAF